MNKKNIYIVQFGTGANINLLPLAAGQLVARLKQEVNLFKKYNLCEIIFRREDPKEIVSRLKDVSVIGFSCFLWNLNITLQTAKEVRKKFPDALIVAGGPAAPNDKDLLEDFFKVYPYIDIICKGEGEESFVDICKKHSEGKGFEKVNGIIYKDKKTGKIHVNPLREEILMETLPSPFLDGTFDEFYKKYKSEISGICWETNRGCPYQCTFCTWGNAPYRRIREKPLEQVKGEIEWIGKNKIKYIAMSDSNFGIRGRDIDLAEMLADCKKKYGVPNFISVSWVKNSSDKVLKISDILRKAGIGFRVTLSFQSLNQDVLRAINRINIKRSTYEEIRKAYHKARLYSYTELILGLPLETYESFLSGIEEMLSESVFDQIYLYPLFLFPNTSMGSLSNRKKYGLKSKVIEGRYTKSKELCPVKEYVEIVVGNSALPKKRWADAFVVGYHTLALHDDRLAFFIFWYLKKNYNIRITELVTFAKKLVNEDKHPILKKSFMSLENCARKVQEKGCSHLIEPNGYGGIPYDPHDGIFLELITNKKQFYLEFFELVKEFLKIKNIDCDASRLKDLFLFQEAVMVSPDGPNSSEVNLEYNWIDYFLFAFNLDEKELKKSPQKLKIIDDNPSFGDPIKFLKNHFEIRGVPAFNKLENENGKIVFPPVDLSWIS